MMKRITTLAVSAITILSLSACKSMPAYTSDYTKAREQVNGVVMDDQKLWTSASDLWVPLIPSVHRHL